MTLRKRPVYQVLTNADTPEDAMVARNNGAEGIGLVRSEHMFFGSDERLRAVRKMIMADNTEVCTAQHFLYRFTLRSTCEYAIFILYYTA
jgi:phosphoenolpyruvate synthase/pyruvate phosphate dikinase